MIGNDYSPPEKTPQDYYAKGMQACTDGQELWDKIYFRNGIDTRG